MPNAGLYIMLSVIGHSNKAFRSIVTLHLFISVITFHTFVSADIKENTAEEYRALGYAQQQKGNLNEALSYYTKATSLGVNSAELLNDMGVLYEEIDLYGKAETHYLDAVQSDPKYLPPYINLAYLYQRLGRSDKAAQYIKLRFELGNPMDPWAQKAKEELLKIDPLYREWTASLEAASLNQQLEAKSRDEFFQRVKRSQEHYQRGEAYFKNDEYEKAVEEYDQALYFAPKNPKTIDARKLALLEIAKKSVKEQSEQALKRLEVGDTLSARHEIQKMLTTIPKEPMLVSPQYAR